MTTTDVTERAAVLFAEAVRERQDAEERQERALAAQRLGLFMQIEEHLTDGVPFVHPPAETSPDGRPPEVCALSQIGNLERLLEYAQTHELTDPDRAAIRRSAYDHGAHVNTLRERHGWLNRREYRRAARVFDALERLVGMIERPADDWEE
jgi:hypothetical protein